MSSLVRSRCQRHRRHCCVRWNEQLDHELHGAKIDLLHQPKFESRNLLLTNDRSGSGLIEPFHFRIQGNGIKIERSVLLYPPDLSRPLHQIPTSYLDGRAPLELGGFISEPERIARATGIISPGTYRTERRCQLEHELEAVTDATTRAAVSKRIEELEVSDPADMRVLGLSLTQTRRFELDGPAVIESGDGYLAQNFDTQRSWPIEFWMGAWDADALCGYVSGRLEIPFFA